MVIGGNKNNYFGEDIWDTIKSLLWLLAAVKISVLLRIFGMPLRVRYDPQYTTKCKVFSNI